jgi:hypothetical protein
MADIDELRELAREAHARGDRATAMAAMDKIEALSGLAPQEPKKDRPFFAPLGQDSMGNAVVALGSEALAIPHIAAKNIYGLAKGTPNKQLVEEGNQIAQSHYIEPKSDLEAAYRWPVEKAGQAIGATAKWLGSKAEGALDYFGDEPKNSTEQMNRDIRKAYLGGGTEVLGQALLPMGIAKGAKVATRSAVEPIINTDISKKIASYLRGEQGANTRGTIALKDAVEGGGLSLNDLKGSIENYSGLNRTPSAAEINPDMTLAAIQGSARNANPEMFSPNMIGSKEALLSELKKNSFDAETRKVMNDNAQLKNQEVIESLPPVPYRQVQSELEAGGMKKPIATARKYLNDESVYTDFPAKYDVSGSKILKTSDLTGAQQQKLHATLNDFISQTSADKSPEFAIYNARKSGLAGALGKHFQDAQKVIGENLTPVNKARYFNEIENALVPASGKVADTFGNMTEGNLSIGNAQKAMAEGVDPSRLYGKTPEEWFTPKEMADAKAIATALEGHKRAYQSGTTGGSSVRDMEGAGVKVPTKLGGVELKLDKGQQLALARLLSKPDLLVDVINSYQKPRQALRGEPMPYNGLVPAMSEYEQQKKQKGRK